MTSYAYFSKGLDENGDGIQIMTMTLNTDLSKILDKVNNCGNIKVVMVHGFCR